VLPVEEFCRRLVEDGVAKWTVGGMTGGMTDMKEENFMEKRAELSKREGDWAATVLDEFATEMPKRNACSKLSCELDERTAYSENHGDLSVQGRQKKGEAKAPHITLKCKFVDGPEKDQDYKTAVQARKGDLPYFKRTGNNGTFLYQEANNFISYNNYKNARRDNEKIVSATFVAISQPPDWEFRHDLLEPDASWVDGGRVLEAVSELASKIHKSFEQYRSDRIGYGLYQEMMDSPVPTKPRRYKCPLCVKDGKIGNRAGEANFEKKQIFKHLETQHKEVKFKQSKEEQNQ
jgi:hypothetical protein